MKVLIVEDEQENIELFREIFEEFFGEQVCIIFARTCIEARKLFRAHSDIDFIFVDACLGTNQPNTTGLVLYFRRFFNGPIIAMSSVARYNDELLAAGATRSSRKSDIWKVLPKTG